MRVREYVERHWWWFAVLAALAIVGLLARWLLPFWLALVVGAVAFLLGIVVRERASTRVIERDRVD